MTRGTLTALSACYFAERRIREDVPHELVASNGTFHLAHHDVTFVAISRGRPADLEAYRKRLGWRFPLVSSYGSDFNSDYHVSFTRSFRTARSMTWSKASTSCPASASSTRTRTVESFHTYSCYARGGDLLLGVYNFLDLTPKGRNEKEILDWVKRNDEYDNSGDSQSACHADARSSAA